MLVPFNETNLFVFLIPSKYLLSISVRYPPFLFLFLIPESVIQLGLRYLIIAEEVFLVLFMLTEVFRVVLWSFDLKRFWQFHIISIYFQWRFRTRPFFLAKGFYVIFGSNDSIPMNIDIKASLVDVDFNLASRFPVSIFCSCEKFTQLGEKKLKNEYRENIKNYEYFQVCIFFFVVTIKLT